jgi:dolichyl-phosphate-mannose-protein mannosyltransferase
MLKHQNSRPLFPQQSLPWFSIGIWLIFLVSLALRFWGLGRFNSLVFDEVYYAKFGNQFLLGKYNFYSHPPLSHYFVALGIWLGKNFSIGNDTVNNLTGSTLSTFSYRWMNALIGSFVPLLVIGIAYQLTRRQSFGLIAGFLIAADGMFLVESRYALNNIYLIFCGLLGQFLLLIALNKEHWQRWLWLLLSGIAFGASIAVKWNGLYFLVGAYLLWAIAWLSHFTNRQLPSDTLFSNSDATGSPFFTPLPRLKQLSLPDISFFLGVVPVVIYALLWIPYLNLERQQGIGFFANFAQEQENIFNYHQGIKDGPKVHPYCSKWFTWPLMLRPLAYFYATARNTSEAVPMAKPLPAGVGEVIYDVHAMGNPLLYLFSAIAILLLVFYFVKNRIQGGLDRLDRRFNSWVILFILLNYIINLLPWVRVTRCTFFYHYLPSSIFAILALAWIIDRWLHSWNSNLKATAITLLFLVLAAFIYWMPIYLGLPLSVFEYRIRMLHIEFRYLPSWIQQSFPWVKEFLPRWI